MAYLLAWILAVEVRQGTLGVDGRGSGPAGNTVDRRSQLDEDDDTTRSTRRTRRTRRGGEEEEEEEDDEAGGRRRRRQLT